MPLPVSEYRSGSAGRKVGVGTDEPAVTSLELPQYSVARVLLTWAAASLPMGVLAWVVAPVLAELLDGPAAWPRAILLSLILGLAWQLALVAVLVHREQGSLRWPVLRDALWLRAPSSPRTGRRGGRLWWLLLPLVAGVAAAEELPALPAPANRDLATFLGSESGQSFLSGNWVWFGLILLMMVLNTALGEELLFRGLLLPRMQGAFGQADWVANAVLFAAYHVHVPWAIPGRLVTGTLYALPSRRYRSAWMGIAVHSAQTVVLGALVLTLVLR